MANLQYISTLDNFASATIKPEDVKFLVTVPKDGGGYESKKISYQDIITRITSMFPESSLGGDVDAKINSRFATTVVPMDNRLKRVEDDLLIVQNGYVTKTGSTTQTIGRPSTFSVRPTLTGDQSTNGPLTKAETLNEINKKTNTFYDLCTNTSTSHIDRWRYYRSASVFSNTDRMYGDKLAMTDDANVNGTGHSRYKYVKVKEKNFVYHRVNSDSSVIVKANHGTLYVFAVIDSRILGDSYTKCSQMVNTMFEYANDSRTGGDSNRAIFTFLGISRYSSTGDTLIIPNVKAGSDLWLFHGVHASDWGFVPRDLSRDAIDVHVTEISNG